MKKSCIAAAALAALVTQGCCGGGEPPPERAPAPAAAAARTRPALEPGVKNVGIVVFDELFITELVAPFDIYKHAGKKLNVFTIAPKAGPVRTYEGIVFEPDFTFADAPKVDVLVVPSGNRSTGGDLEDQAFMGWVKRAAGEAEWVTSHCWGAFTLAGCGLLDGKEATTFPTSVADLGKKFPAVKTRADTRFVVAGKVVTSSGGLAAFEAALFVVEKLLGKEEADKIAAGLVFAPENVTNSRRS